MKRSLRCLRVLFTGYVQTAAVRASDRACPHAFGAPPPPPRGGRATSAARRRCPQVLYHTILYYTILYCTVLYYTMLYYTILYYTMLCYTVLYHTILYYTILYCTILCYTIKGRKTCQGPESTSRPGKNPKRSSEQSFRKPTLSLLAGKKQEKGSAKSVPSPQNVGGDRTALEMIASKRKSLRNSFKTKWKLSELMQNPGI